MKKSLAFFAAVLAIAFLCIIAVTQQACNKNVKSCGNLTCQNGGQCANGGCICPQGYSGYTCDTPFYAQFVGTYIGSISGAISSLRDTIVVAGVTGFPDSMVVGGLTGSVDLISKMYIPQQIAVVNNDTLSETGVAVFSDTSLTINLTVTPTNTGVSQYSTFIGYGH